MQTFQIGEQIFEALDATDAVTQALALADTLRRAGLTTSARALRTAALDWGAARALSLLVPRSLRSRSHFSRDRVR